MKNEKRAKILFVILDLFKVGGAERVVIDQINNLDKNIFDVFLCNLGGNSDRLLSELVNIDLNKTKKFNFKSLFDIYSWIKFISWLKIEKFDIIYSHLFFANFVGRISGKLVGIKKIISVEHNIYLDRSFIQRLSNFLLSFITHKIIAVSESVKKYLIKKELINSSKITPIYNGVDSERYFFNKQSRDRIRKSFNFTEQDLIIISVGRVTEQKGYDLLIETANEMVNFRKIPVHFLVVGYDNNDIGRKLKKDVVAYNLSNHVIFLGLSNEVPDLLSSSDVFFMPSKWEGFGLALVEGMANGKPVLVNKISILEEMIGQDNRYGLVGRNPKEFANLLVKLKEDRTFYEKYVNLSLQRSADFSLKENIKQITKLFLEK